MKKLLSGVEAANLLGVSTNTLYSYVSRGLLSSLPGTGERGKLYPRDQVLRLAARRKDGRKAGHAVEQAIDWGKPIQAGIAHAIEQAASGSANPAAGAYVGTYVGTFDFFD